MEKQKESLIRFYRSHRRMPGYQELMALWGYKSKNAVYKLIQKLVEAGVIYKDSSGHLSPAHGFNEIKLLGLVEAGIPTSAEAEVLDTVSLDELLVERSDKSYLLRVKGESMIEAGIREGDMVVAEQCKEAKDGDIVIAEVDSGWTMKYLKHKNGKPYLLPANHTLSPIYPKDSLHIAAVVKAVIRKY